jgi:hypothetical protein
MNKLCKKLERNQKYVNEEEDLRNQKKYNSKCLIGNWSGEKVKQDVSFFHGNYHP